MKRFARDLIIGFSISSMVANPNYAAGLEEKIADRPSIEQKSDGNIYGLLISGFPENFWSSDSREVHLAAISDVKSSIKKLGARDEHIYVLTEQGREKMPSTMPSFYDALEKNHFYSNSLDLEIVLQELKEKITKNDKLLVYYIGIGSIQKYKEKDHFMYLFCTTKEHNGESEISVRKLQESLNDAKANFGILLFDCGGNGYQIDAPRYSIITSSAEGIALLEKDYSFGRNFFRNLSMPKSDKNKDNIVSISEAYNTSLEQHLNKQYNIALEKIREGKNSYELHSPNIKYGSHHYHKGFMLQQKK